MIAPPTNRIPLLAEFDDEVLASLTPYLEGLHLGPGQELFREGSVSEGVYLLTEGRLQLEARSTGSLGEVGPGAVLGAFALVATSRREASARAETSAELLLLRREAFLRLADEEPRIACRLLASLLEEVGDSLRAGARSLCMAG